MYALLILEFSYFREKPPSKERQTSELKYCELHRRYTIVQASFIQLNW